MLILILTLRFCFTGLYTLAYQDCTLWYDWSVQLTYAKVYTLDRLKIRRWYPLSINRLHENGLLIWCFSFLLKDFYNYFFDDYVFSGWTLYLSFINFPLKIFGRNKETLYLCTRWKNAEIAQLVEHNLAKVRVASSSLVFRSLWKDARMVEW